MPSTDSSESPDTGALGDLRNELKDLNQTLKKSIEVSDRFTWALIIIGIFSVITPFFASTDFIENGRGIAVFLLLVAALLYFVKPDRR